ncbi:nuclear transcription factor Y subunit B-9-like [Rosa rugosa]|uniref:nuclear transcription factor Y subunit B-9-like n=1 Tax=Rosa rugosa TaxID=74645 RepID=UPI002B412EEE|nr:nuclear transcription factor Y subunit B-9-like [Rosa rugosa]
MDPVSGLDRFRSNNNNRQEKSTTASDPAQVTDAVNVNGGNNSEAAIPRLPVAPCMVREQDQYMPIANVIRIMRRILPPHAKISDDAKETVQECVSEYISFITGEANERCQREQRKTVAAEDVLWAMGKLGFDNYIEPLSLFLSKYREAEGTERSSSLFAKCERGDGGMVEYAPVLGHYGPPGFGLAAQQPWMHKAGAMMSGYYGGAGGSGNEGGGAGSSSASQRQGQSAMGGGFDPFAQFK